MFDAITGPLGGVPEADAVLMIDPAFTLVWVIVCVAVQVVDPPGARMVAGHEIADNPVNGSVTATEVNVTLPVFVRANEKVCVSPNDAPVGAVSVVRATVLVSVIVFVCTIGVVVDELFDVTAGPDGGVPEADAVLTIDPASTSS